MRVISSGVHQAHHGLELFDAKVNPSIEGPDRADLIGEALETAGHRLIEPGPVDPELLRRVHDSVYVDFLASAWDRWQERETPGPAAMGFTWAPRGASNRRPDDLIGQLGYHSFAADCSIVAGTWAAATSAAAIATTAADHTIATGETSYGLCRPPGHHATADQFGGYCYLNNAAIAAQRFLDHGATRVAILDVDYHHGNGTQSIFYDRSDVMFVSLHADPTFEFPWFAGHADETGTAAGAGWNLNLPLPRATDYARWSEALETALGRIVDAGVDALIVSLGVDIYADDPLGTFGIETADFGTMATRIGSIGVPLTIVQEGGYAVAAIGDNVAAFLAPLTS